MPQLLQDIGSIAPWLVAGLCLAGGLAAIVLMRRSPLRERRDRGTAVRIGALLGVLAGGIAGYLVGSIAARWAGSGAIFVIPAAMAIVGVPLFAVVLGAALSGYALLARLGAGTRALAGAVAGPLVAGAIVTGGLELTKVGEALAFTDIQDDERRAAAVVSQALRISATDIETSIGDDGSVELVRLTAVVEAAATVQFPLLANKWVVALTPDAGENLDARILAELPVARDSWVAGSTTTYGLIFDPITAGAPARGRPGTWMLSMGFVDSNGEGHWSETTIEIRP